MDPANEEGLLSLTVEFFRTGTSPCTKYDSGELVSSDPTRFGYNTTCGLVCSTDVGPFSHLRGGSANNIYVIPAPSLITFGAATLLAAACCIPAILSLVSMWNKILQANWKRRWGKKVEDEGSNEPIEGTNGATVEEMNRVNSYIRRFLSAVEAPVFGAAVLAILIAGEMNFWSQPVVYQTEPIASIGKCSSLPITLHAPLETDSVCRSMVTYCWDCFCSPGVAVSLGV